MTEPAWSKELLTAPHAVEDKARRVRRMFDAIAPRYELINALFSGGRDAYWRREAVEAAGVCPTDDVLDVACGTGDLARAFAAAGPRRVIGCDFAHSMLRRACDRRTSRIDWVEGDALQLPFPAESFSIVSCAFGVRNFQDLDAGLREMRRVLRPGGRAVILEFSRLRRRWIRVLYEAYSNRVMPAAASWISGDRMGAYRYLPRSVASFMDPEELLRRCRNAGFGRCALRPLTGGIVTVYSAWMDP
jgi:demethylmenaquinone methyltransferase/2-methoxy-6-polyprenyl-1,4-benzoquinol methylase